MSVREIARAINRGKSSVGSYIMSRRNSTTTARAGKWNILSLRGRRAVVRIAARGRMTARKVLAETKAPVSLHTMQRILQQDRHLASGPLLLKTSSQPSISACVSGGLEFIASKRRLTGARPSGQMRSVSCSTVQTVRYAAGQTSVCPKANFRNGTEVGVALWWERGCRVEGRQIWLL